MFTYQFHIHQNIDNILINCDIVNVEYNLQYRISKKVMRQMLGGIIANRTDYLISKIMCELVREGILATMSISMHNPSELSPYQLKIFRHVMLHPISELIEDRQSIINFEECVRELMCLIY